MVGDEHHGRRTAHAGAVVGAFAVAGIAALVALLVPHLTADDPSPVVPTDLASSCLTPTPSTGSGADWTICWDE